MTYKKEFYNPVKYISCILEKGQLALCTPTDEAWPEQRPVEEICADYAQWCLDTGRKAVDARLFGREFQQYLGAERVRKWVSAERVYFYEIPPLEEARKIFAKAFAAGGGLELWKIHSEAL